MIRLAFVHQLAFHEMDGWWVVSMPLVKKTVTTPDKTRARSQVAKDFRITKTSTKNLRIPETKRRSPLKLGFSSSKHGDIQWETVIYIGDLRSM